MQLKFVHGLILGAGAATLVFLFVIFKQRSVDKLHVKFSTTDVDINVESSSIQYDSLDRKSVV